MSAIGFQTYNPDVTLNFMSNRMAADIAPDELRTFAAQITDIDGWIEAALAAAETAESNGRFKEAGSYFRGAEFFMAPDHPRKNEAYDRFMDLFEKIHPEVADRRSTAPYGDQSLSVIDIPAEGEEKDVIVACSGFDGLIEEMYEGMFDFANAGYRVILYEGPGQGAALRRSHMPMDHEWEKAVSAILDYLQIESCTLLGVSLGGYLAPRAAALEPRVKRLIAWGAMYEFIDCFRPRMGDETFAGLMGLVDAGEQDVVNKLLTASMADNATTRWSITHGVHTCGGETPFDFLNWARKLHLRDVSEKIMQDTLILAGSKDHLVPSTQIWDQAAALENARSVTVRVFTEHEHAAEHCQVTNRAVVNREILSWLERLACRD
jgi:pimeloyl-ACP methyl ester carboxylesterase